MAILSARWHRSIQEIPEQQWCCLLKEQVIPFYRWGWLAALENSESIEESEEMVDIQQEDLKRKLRANYAATLHALVATRAVPAGLTALSI